MAQKFVGIDLGSHTVKAVVVTAGFRGAQVVASYEQSVDPSAAPDPLGASLAAAAALLRERGLRHLPTGVALPGGSGSYRVLSFPFSDARRIAQAVGFEVEGQFPVPVSELAFDHVPLPGPNKTGRALVVAAKSELEERVASALSDAGAEVKLVTVGALALAQALDGLVPSAGNAEADEEPVCLIVDLGHKTTELLAMGNKGPVAARTLRRGGRHLDRVLQKTYGFDEPGAQTAKERDAFLPGPDMQLDADQAKAGAVVAEAMQHLVRELEHTRQWLLAEHHARVTELRIVGGGALLKGLVSWLARELEVPVSLAEPKEGPALKKVAGQDWTRKLVALGVAVGTARRPIIQLHDQEGGDGDGAWIQERFTTLVALGVAVVTFASIDTIVRVNAVEKQRDAYAEQLAQSSETMFGVSMSSTAEVEGVLASVEGSDLTSEIPVRGAFELLEAISRAATPAGGRAAVAPGAGPSGANPFGGPADGSATVGGVPGAPGAVVTGIDPSGNPTAIDPATGAPPAASPSAEGVTPAPVDADGILADDQLVFSMLDIRPLKIDAKITATRATAFDRLAMKIQAFGCMNDRRPRQGQDP
jgi:type IV pilus assembly protein PilM